jgi:DNA polymerase-3 subunit delta'
MPISHHKQWEFLKNKFESNQLSHSYLLSGNGNIGKKELGKEFVKFINCLSAQAELSPENKQSCGRCANCIAIEAESFPDLMIIKPEDGGEIQIAKIREAQNFLSYKSYYGFFKSVIVENAEKMNIEAQSCFLKTLEEPKGKTLLFLISSKPEILLDTIRSRCQQIKFFGNSIIDEKKLEKNRQILAEILPMVGANFAEKFKYAKSIDFEKTNLTEILEPLETYTRYMIFKKLVGDQKKYFADLPSAMENYPVEKLKKIIETTEEINTKILFTNVNQKLALETLLLEI